MTHRRMLLSCLVLSALFACIASPAAQEPPTLAGTWTLESSFGSLPGAGSSGGGGRASGGSMVSSGRGESTTLTITQTSMAITIGQGSGDSARRKTYQLDGSESVNVAGNATSRTVSRWDGGRLVTSGTQSVSTSQGDVSAQFHEVISLDADGKLHVETARERDGAAIAPSRQVYVRQSDR